MTKGIVTSEDITREYLARLSLYDRHGPTFRAILALNPRAIADARARDAERAAGTRAQSISRRPGGLQGQHRRHRVADHRRLARARRSSPAPRFARGRRHEAGRRRRPRQGQPRRVSLRRLRHQHRRRHGRQRLRSVAQHGRIERRQRDRGGGEPRRARVRHRHLQLALESRRLRVAGHDSSDARSDSAAPA